jgi:pimeloyl-ACP methyl ester carboxylesterase
LADFDAMFKTDPKRQYLYGFSMGGAGTFQLAQKTLNRWAAVGLYSAAIRGEITLAQAEKFKYIPVWMCWGEKEDRLAANNRILKDYFLQAGVNLWWTEVKDVGHNYLGQYQDSLMNWFLTHHKQ